MRKKERTETMYSKYHGIGVFSLAFAAILLAAQTCAAMEFVAVGDPGNSPDTRYDATGYGAVAHEYSIGKYEVTAGQYRDFLNAAAATDVYGLYNSGMDSDTYGCQITQTGSSGSYTYDFSGAPSGTVADWENRPVNYVSWYDAARYANYLTTGNTENGAYTLTGPTTVSSIMDHQTAATIYGTVYVIPTENEWYKAAYYDGSTGTYYDYPTGSNSAPGYVNNSGNLSGTSTPFADGVTDPGNYATYDGDGDPNGVGSPYYRTNVGEWEASASPYGTFDQGGNVWEWN